MVFGLSRRHVLGQGGHDAVICQSARWPLEDREVSHGQDGARPCHEEFLRLLVALMGGRKEGSHGRCRDELPGLSRSLLFSPGSHSGHLPRPQPLPPAWAVLEGLVRASGGQPPQHRQACLISRGPSPTVLQAGASKLREQATTRCIPSFNLLFLRKNSFLFP